jgi:hypothetical protein
MTAARRLTSSIKLKTVLHWQNVVIFLVMTRAAAQLPGIFDDWIKSPAKRK